MHYLRYLLCLGVFLLPSRRLYALSEVELKTLLEQQNVEAIRALGPEIMPQLVQQYLVSDSSQKTKLAAIFYGLAWKSEEAKSALMQDVKTEDQALRLQVQWALGRVSSDDDVVQQLLDNMRRDPNPLFRDKAACALAHDQVHLTEKQKAKLYQGVIDALEDEKDDVRRIAAQVLHIQTGQTKNYVADAPLEKRNEAIVAWRAWLEEYRKATAHDP